MKITAVTLFIILSVFHNCFEFISSQPQLEPAEPTTLKVLFPGSNGVHFPLIEELDHAIAQSFPKFQILDGHHMVEQAATYFKRGDVIFGYKEGDRIRILCSLFRLSYVLPYVFSTKNEQWYILSLSEILRLGATRSLRLVRAHDEAAALTHSLHDEAKPQAHHAASEAAYRATLEHEVPIRISPFVSHEDRIKSVREHYLRKYNEEYERHTGGPSGEH